jgi:5-(carboxyamino)imidazole ribonucleotide mutase
MKAVMLLGSTSDMDHANSIADMLTEDWGIESDILVGSAHKVPEKVFNLLTRMNEEEGIVYVTIAGRSNALSGVVAANSVHPVLACPPFKDKADFMVNINSTLQMPSETPVLTVLDPKNCAASIARIFGLNDEKMRGKIVDRIQKVKAGFDLGAINGKK